VISNLTAKFYPYTLTVLRIMIGFMFWQHGLQKFGYLPGNVPDYLEPRWFAGVLELFGGILIALGMLTRPVAFLLCGQMAVAYFYSHAPRGFWPILNGGERAFLFCFIFLFLVTTGAGKFSVDGWMAKKFGTRWWT